MPNTLPITTPKMTRKRAPKIAPTETPIETPKPADHLATYAYAGVAVMSILSAVLNGYDHAQHAPNATAGWLIGIVIPLIILILGKVAGVAHKRGAAALALTTAAAGVGLLALSVYHCTLSIATLTGSPGWLALPMAVAIDVGFICCEYALLQD